MGKTQQRRIQQHIDQWKHNRQFAKTIESAYRDWQINVIFYTALHAIDAAMASLGVMVRTTVSEMTRYEPTVHLRECGISILTFTASNA